MGISLSLVAATLALIAAFAGPCSSSARRAEMPDVNPGGERVVESRERNRVESTSSPKPSVVDAVVPATGSPLLHEDGWPVAKVLVHHPDGSPAEAAVVWVHPAGAPCGALPRVARTTTDGKGHARIPVPWTGRFDVGAFHPSTVFHTLVTDVDLPMSEPVTIVLPQIAAIHVRVDGELPPGGRVSFVPTAAKRVCAFPGRGETKYTSCDAVAGSVRVPLDVPMRVQVPPGIVANSSEVTAPGSVVLSGDGRRRTSVVVRFGGSARLTGHRAILRGTVELVDGPADARQEFRHRCGRGTGPTFTAFLHLPDEPCVLRWRFDGLGEGRVPVPRASLREPSGVRVDVPVADWSTVPAGLAAMVHRGESEPGSSFTIVGLDDGTRHAVRPEETAWIDAEPGSEVVAVATTADGDWFVSESARLSEDATATLTLRRAGAVVVRVERPSALSSAWELSVVRADGGPIVTAGSPPRARNVLGVSRGGCRIEALPPGDVELVVRLRGRPVARRMVVVRAGQETVVEFPPLRPPLAPSEHE